MKGWLLLILVAAACGTGNDVTDGTRGPCAAGGALNTCPEADHTVEGACWRLVDCGAIPLHADNDTNIFDWDNCVVDLEGLSTVGQQLAIDCIAASTCDELKVQDSPANGNGHVYPDQFRCYLLGTGGN